MDTKSSGKMGDKSKLKTGNLGANVMEESETLKRLGSMKRQRDYFVANVQAEQTFLAKRFLSHLHRSKQIAEEKDVLMKSFNSTRGNRELKSRRSEVSMNSRKWSSTNNKGYFRDIEQEKEEHQNPSLLLRKMQQRFQVPYKKMYSFDIREFERPASVLDMRCKLWQRISYCHDGKDRAKSACLAPKTNMYKAPSHIQFAHYRALQYLGMQANLVHPPSRQPQIDVEALRSYRNSETEIERRAVEKFSDSIKEFKLTPGPGKVIYDTNKLYGELSKLNSKRSK